MNEYPEIYYTMKFHQHAIDKLGKQYGSAFRVPSSEAETVLNSLVKDLQDRGLADEDGKIDIDLTGANTLVVGGPKKPRKP